MNLEKVGAELEKCKKILLAKAVAEGDSAAAREAQQRGIDRGTAQSARQR
jgi:hypothetical protein